MKRPVRIRGRQSGATVIEFALSLLLFLTFFLGILDLSRMLYTWNAANEAARAGARFAVVCDDSTRASLVLARMKVLLPQIRSVDVQWQPASCDASSCAGVTVRITGLDYQWISPIAGVASMSPMPMPEFASYLPREVMRQDLHSSTLCTP